MRPAVVVEDAPEAQDGWNTDHMELVGYWCSLSQRMFPAPRDPSAIRCCGGVHRDHRPPAVFKITGPTS